MSRFEIYSPEGLRADGRRWNELRHIKCGINTHPKSADGSAVVEMGASKVVCIVQGPQEPETRSRVREKATLSVGVTVAPFSTTERSKHVTNDRRLQEMSANLQNLFEEAVLTHLHPRTEIVCSLTVIAQDGGLLSCCVNAMTLALIDAGLPMYEYVSACSVALFDQTPLLDPNNVEETELASVTVGIVGETDKISLLILERRLGLDRLPPALELGVEGCKVLRQVMDKEVRRHGAMRLASRAE